MRCCLLTFCLVLLLPLVASAEDRDYLSFATEDEANTTEIFGKASPSVVYVTNTATFRRFHAVPGAGLSGTTQD